MAARLIAAVALALASAAPASAQVPLPDFDSRHVPSAPAASAPEPEAGVALAGRPGGVAIPDRLRGGTRVVRRFDGFLTGPSTADPVAIALRFVRTHPGALGLSRADLATLSQTRRWRSADGVTHIFWEQRAHGVVAFDNELRAHVTRDGRLISIGGSTRPGLAGETSSAKFRIDAAAARRAARRGAALRAGAPVGRPTKTWLSDGGEVIPAWRVRARALPYASYDMLIDARTGVLRARHNSVRGLGRALVYENYPGAPFGGTATEQDLSRWLDADERLRGNFIHAWADLDASEEAGPREEIPPSSEDGDWLYPFTPFTQTAKCKRLICSWNHKKRRSWRTNLRAEVTQAFYFANAFYERLREFGFTEAAGNFQRVNRSGRGKEGDPIHVLAAYSANIRNGFPAELNNARMSTDPDGTPGVMYLFLNSNEGYDTTTSFDAATVYHELTHGLVGRLLADKTGYAALLDQGEAINEGSADWFAYSYLNANGSVPDGPESGDVVMFEAETPDRKGIRPQPLDCAVGAARSICPKSGGAGAGGFTYADYGKVYDEPESHGDGVIWAQTMWDLRAKFVEAYGFAGIERIERLFINAMQLSVNYPTFLDMRNALLEADLVTGGADRDRIWEAFAGRGMGLFASTTGFSDERVTEDFTTPPPVGTPTGTISGTVRDLVTGDPLKGADVVVSGLALSDATDADGRFQIEDVPEGRAPLVFAFKPGFHYDVASKVKVTAGKDTKQKFELPRNWSSRYSGARIVGPKDGRQRCGPAGAIDDEVEPWYTGRKRPQRLTVKLRRPVDILLFGIDPGVDCEAHYIDDTASAGRIKIEVAQADREFIPGGRARFDRKDNFFTNVVDPGNFVLRRVRYIRVTVREPQGRPRRREEAGESYKQYMGIGELEVFGTLSRR